MLDTSYAIEAPEGIDITLRPAGPLSRILAYVVDLIIRGCILFAFSIVLSFLGAFGSGVIAILYFALEWFYPLFFEVFNQGMTPGKKSFAIRVVHDDGTPISWNSSLIRNLLRAADILPFAYCTGLISMVIDGNFRRLGDIAAGTVVVYHQDIKISANTPGIGTSQIPLSLSDDERRMILNYADRYSQLSEQRQEELADILAPLTGEKGKYGVTKLIKMANGLKGTG